MAESPTGPDRNVRHGEIARLLMQHRAALYGFIYACIRNHDDTEDVFQNVSVAVTESIDQLRDEAGFLPWAREIARRRILAFRRGVQREVVFDPAIVQAMADASKRIEEQLPASDHQVALRACLESLPGESRRLIVLRYEKSSGDVAALARKFGRTVQSIYAQLKRIKLALRECVARRLALEQV